MANEFRTVNYQGQAGVQPAGTIKVASGQQALDSDINYQSNQLQRAGEARFRQDQATLDNNKRLDALKIDEQRLTLDQTNSRNRTILQNQQLYGEQRLANRKLHQDQKIAVQQLQLVHQAKVDELKQINQRQDLESITQFGQQMMQFSGTLWKAHTDRQREIGEEMEAQAVIDYMLNPDLGETLRVDQAQYGRLAKQNESSQLASQLEKAGLPNDAARIRAANPFYLHSMQEMHVIAASKELPQYLTEVALQAQKSGILVKGDPDYAVKLQAIQYDALKGFLREKGISSMNPVVVARYLQGPLLDSMSSVTKQFNAENNAAVREAAKSQAIGDAQASFEMLSDPVEVNKHVNQVYAQGGAEGLKDLYEVTAATANLTGNNAPMVGLMSHPMMQERFSGDYARWEQTRLRNAETALKQTQEDNYRLATAQWELQVARANPADLPRMREEFLKQHEGSLAMEHFVSLQKTVMGTKAVDAGHLSTRVEDVLSLGSERDIAQALKNPALPPELKEKLQKGLEARQKQLDPQAQQALKSAQNLVLGKPLAGIDKGPASAVNPIFQQQLNAVIKERQDELARRSRIYWSRPEATLDGYQVWLDTKNKDLIDTPITVDQNGNLPELGKMVQTPKATIAIPPAAISSYRGKQVVWMTETNTRNAVMKGSYGYVDANNNVLLTKQEIIAFDNQYAQSGQYSPTLVALAVRARVRPDELLSAQARVHGLSGSPALPPVPASPATTNTGKPGEPISRATVQQIALSSGLSPRGAIWLATNMMDESSGNPNAIHDGGDGYGLFGHQGGRLDNMRSYAASKGRDISDAHTQVQFAIDEIRSRYPDVWRTVSAPNPSLNDLWRASKTWEGFHHSVYEHRLKSLRTSLGE